MAAKLTDKKKKKIVADYLETQSINAAAKKNGVSWCAAKAALDEAGEVEKKLEQKKDENTTSILAHMESKRDVVNEIITKGLDVLNSPEKLAEATPAQITTALGTLIDKFTPVDKRAEKDRPVEIPARLIGRAFVDVNRHIMPNRSYIFKGGRGGLKSSYISLKVPELLVNNPNIHACVVRKQTNTLKDSVYSQIRWAINELGLYSDFDFKVSPLEITYKKTGQKIYFRGCDDPVKLKSIKPPFGYIGILWIEERDQLAGAAEERSVKQSVLRGGNDSYFFGSFNPPKSRANWVNQQLLEADENRVVHSATYLDAPPEWLGKMFLTDAEHLKEVNREAYEHEYLGIPNGDGGNVFDNIEQRRITDDEVKRFDKIYQGIDFGWYPDPFAFVRIHYDVARETLYLIDEIGNNKTSNQANADEIRRRGYNDFPVVCDSAEPKSVQDLRSCGVNAREAVKGPGSVEYGMKWLQCRKIIVDPTRTPKALKELMNYEYEKDKDGNVISGYPDHDNHFIDAIRYAIEPVSRRYGVRA